MENYQLVPTLEKYKENINQYEKFLDLAMTNIEKMLKDIGIKPAKLEGRVKTPESFYNKLETKKVKYKKPLEEMTDIIGIRIITYYQDDIDVIIDGLKNNFNIDYANSLNKFNSMDPDRMGYMSVHYVCTLKQDRLSMILHEEYEIFDHIKENNFKFELQIKTSLQHIWAAIDHKLRYKSLVDLPKHLERDLFRLSSLLEVADSEFVRLKNEISSLESFYTEKFDHKNYNLRLDLSSINFYLSYNDRKIFQLAQNFNIYYFNFFSTAKQENLEKKLLHLALNHGLNRVEHIETLLAMIEDNYEFIISELGEQMLKKLSYLINSSCSLIIIFIQLLYEDDNNILDIYKLNNENLIHIHNIRHRVLSN